MADDAWTPNPEVVLTGLPDGTAVLLHLETKFYFTLNATGVFVWRQLVEAPTVEGTRAALVEALVATFDVTPERAAADLDALVRELRAERLLVARR